MCCSQIVKERNILYEYGLYLDKCIKMTWIKGTCASSEWHGRVLTGWSTAPTDPARSIWHSYLTTRKGETGRQRVKKARLVAMEKKMLFTWEMNFARLSSCKVTGGILLLFCCIVKGKQHNSATSSWQLISLSPENPSANSLTDS